MNSVNIHSESYWTCLTMYGNEIHYVTLVKVTKDVIVVLKPNLGKIINIHISIHFVINLLEQYSHDRSDQTQYAVSITNYVSCWSVIQNPNTLN